MITVSQLIEILQKEDPDSPVYFLDVDNSDSLVMHEFAGAYDITELAITDHDDDDNPIFIEGMENFKKGDALVIAHDTNWYPTKPGFIIKGEEYPKPPIVK